jgi:hypothetical protein
MWKDIKTAARGALIGLAGSKKAWTGLMTAIAAAAMRLGFDISPETVGLVVTPLVGVIIGQGVADRGKQASTSEPPP